MAVRTINDIANRTKIVSSSIASGTITATNIANGIEGQIQSPYMFRNRLINGNFDFWQRGISLSGAGYLADRWVTNIGGSSITTSQQAFTLGQTAVPGEPKYFIRHVTTSSAGASNYIQFIQKIEGVRQLAGKTVTLSFYAKADSSKNIALELSQSFGTGGSPSSTVSVIGVTTFALTSGWQKFTATIQLPSISGKVIGINGDDCVWVTFWLDAGSSYNVRTNSLGQQSGTFDFAQVQLEEGSVATPFEQRMNELDLCQRYYEVCTDDVISIGAGVNTAAAYLSTKFSVQKRASPTVVTTAINGSGFTAKPEPATVNSDVVKFSATQSTSGGNAWYEFSWTATAEL